MRQDFDRINRLAAELKSTAAENNRLKK